MIFVAHIKDVRAKDERRGAERHQSGFVLSIGAGEEGVEALISDLSQTGLRLHSKVQCEIGSTIEIEIPGHAPANAKVAWRRGDEIGCEFEQPISRATVSAIILRSPVDSSGVGDRDRIVEVRLGVNLEAAGVADWIRDFEASNIETGRRVAGFRVSENGEVVALISEAH